jgi:hypothetical protein
MFSTLAGLRRWASQHDLGMRPMTGVSPTSALRVKGQYRCGSRATDHRYDQVWARIKYSCYAKALQASALHFANIGRASLAGIHADHVINRARLGHHPQAWVMIFPVPREANSPFGSIERRLAIVPQGQTRIDLTPLIALKLYCGFLPRTQRELDSAMIDVLGQIGFAKEFCDQMHVEASHFVGSGARQSRLSLR